jgi:hypothetical protein
MPDDRTQEETDEGFEYDPDTDSVFYPLNHRDRVVKAPTPHGGKPQYTHKRFGRRPTDRPNDPDRWIPIHGPVELPPPSAKNWGQGNLHKDPDVPIVPKDPPGSLDSQ